MKTLRIRKFMVIGMYSVVIFPWMIYFFIHFINGLAIQNGTQAEQQKINETITIIVTNSAKWENPEWQKSLRSQLLKENIQAQILSPSKQLIFKSRNLRSNPWMSNQQFTVIENGKILGTVKLYSQMKSDIIGRILAIVALILGIFFVGYKMKKNIVKPLEAMSGTARQIAEGDLDLHLPVSRVTEIEEVRSGFEVMVAGLRESFKKQAKLEEERRFFIGAIAHDLRTPLFALRGYLDGLEKGIATSPEKISKYVSVCKEKSNQLDRLVSDLFAFTKLEYMEQTLHCEKIEIEHILTSSIQSFNPLAKEKEVFIEMEFPAYKCEIIGDSHLLERAINNLLDNAIRHTPNGSKIIVNWYKEPGKVSISVRDSGPGFSRDDLTHIFDPLYRGEVSRNRATGGAGLGLTIARRIFIAHGGELSATNHPDGGAVLIGWIPVQN